MTAAANTSPNANSKAFAAGATISNVANEIQTSISKVPAFFPDSSTEIVRGGLAPWQYRKVMKFIEEHLAETIRIDELSEMVRLSGSHFSRAFRATVGQSPYDYVLSRRMAFAQELMAETDASLSQIALECGMSDQAHLCKVFRRTFGTTPNKWRKPHRNALRNTLH